ncbi:LysR substrate-binding domain-containing protein [Comamonas odontotermitis]|uniref:LysR substrate-binding domain-containing protein n=1 Tax=Comamonas odontotermitis TaxID=379895 RepID=UPI0037523625
MPKPLSPLPSLDLLRTLVAVGQRMSITLAAQDLYLTQSAVSKQIRQLEQTLGVALLVRGHRSIAFTTAGERLYQSAAQHLHALHGTLAQIAAQGQRHSVTVSASIGITALWLLPRLGRFQQRCPDVDVRVAADNRLHGPQTPDIDLAIRYCAAQDAPAGAQRLFGESLVPVAHPSLNAPQLKTPAQVDSLVLLELDLPNRPWLHWHGWLQAQGLPASGTQRMLRYNQYDQVIHAAIAGQGVAIGRYELIAPMLDDGRLVALGPIDPTLSPYGYWLVPFASARQRHADGAQGALARFAQWVREEAGVVA